ncbi:sec23/Sec24 protein transport family protein [Artemisia annua]|uniref:Sec23/Sec24 protein transport family protein n=1 Tax=Artemisia annua TaxID=35608 RepID=A0A2U1PV52_ARTAN|nr:sec23/Sec24 protein transport family protein [Artemisia annua]
MGTENPNRANIYQGPAATPFAAPRSNTPFAATPMVGSEASAFRPTSVPGSLSTVPAASSTTPFSPPGPAVGSGTPGFRPMQPGRPAPPYGPPTTGPTQRFPTPQFPSTSLPGQPIFPPAMRPPPPGHVPPMSTHINRQPQIPSVPMGSPPQSLYTVSSNNNPPKSFLDSPYSASRPNMQQPPPSMGPPYPGAGQASLPSAVPGYPGVQSSAFTSPPQPPPVSYQGGYAPPQATTPAPFSSHQGAYGQAPPVASAPGMYAGGSPPPTGAMSGLVEDFSSLSLGSAPGSFDTGLDTKVLPRPLDGDVEPSSFAEMYPMNCDSRYLRLTTSAIPSSQSLVSRWHLPLGAVVCPLAETPEGEEVPVVNFATTGIVRCRRCRTYVNPYVTFTDGGRKWRCNICALLNDVQGDYYAQLDSTGRRVDLDQRPELTKGSVEFVAPAEYMVRPPMPPLYFFLIDVSISAVKSGMLEVMAQTIKSSLDRLPGSTRTQIGFITFDSTIHFYNMKSSLTQPQMMVVSDLEDVFVPLPDDLLVNLSESRTVVEAFLDSLPSMFQDNVNVESAFGPALKAAYMVMSQLGGKLLIFQSTLPSLGVGRLRLRGDDLRVYGTDKEYALRIPEDPFYKQMAADFTKFQVAVNIYAFSDKYSDIASLGTLAKYTGGQVYYYPSFHSAIHKDKLRHELARDLTRETAWEAVMRIRCGKGVRFTSYHGNFMLRSTDLIALPAVDCDKAYAMQFALEETLLTTQIVYFQVALLYTASCGERRIRVHTAAASVVTDLGEMYRQADTGAVVSLLGRLAIEKSLSYKLEEARSAIQLKIVKALKEYRKLYSGQHRVGSRMIYPESLKYLPLYGLSLCKSIALRGGYADAQLDERCAAGFTMMALPVKKMLKLLYPSLLRVDEYLVKTTTLDDEFYRVCTRLPLVAESLDSRGIYIFDDGFRFVVWFGRMLSPDIARNLVEEDPSSDFSRNQVCLNERDNGMSRKLMGILNKLREGDASYYQLCHLVRQGEQPREGFFLLLNLVEDQVSGMSGYADWLLQIHRQVQQ